MSYITPFPYPMWRTEVVEEPIAKETVPALDLFEARKRQRQQFMLAYAKYAKLKAQYKRRREVLFDVMKGERQEVMRQQKYYAMLKQRWMTQLKHEYPSDLYRIEWTGEGAVIRGMPPTPEKVLTPYTRKGYQPLISRYGPTGPEYLLVEPTPEKTPLISRYGPTGPEFFLATPTPTKTVEKQVTLPPSIRKFMAEPHVYPKVAERPELYGYKPATALEDPFALQRLVRQPLGKRAIIYVHPEPVFKPGPGFYEREPASLSYQIFKIGKQLEKGFWELPVVVTPPFAKKPTVVQPFKKYEKPYTEFLHKYPAAEPILYFTVGTPAPWNVMYAIAGTTAAFEAWVQPHEAAPTLTGESLDYLLGRGFRQKWPTGEYIPTAYWVGESFGEYVQAVAIAKALGKITGHPRVRVSRPAKLVHRAKLWRIEHLPAYRASRLDIWLAKHSRWYYAKTGGIAPGEVVLPLATEPISYAKLEAVSSAFEMTVAPRTGGVWVGKYFIEPTAKKGLPHMFISVSRGFVAGPAYLKQYGFERVSPETMLTPLVSQQQLTRMGIYPYVPKVVTVSTVATRQLFGWGALTLGRGLIPKAKRKYRRVSPVLVTPKLLKWQPTLAFERLKLRPLELLERREKEKVAPILKVSPIAKAKSIEKVAMRQVQVPKQIQLPKFVVPHPYITRRTPIPEPPILPPTRRGGIDTSQIGRDFLGKWFKRKHPILTPKELMQKVGFAEPKRRRKKGRKPRYIL